MAVKFIPYEFLDSQQVQRVVGVVSMVFSTSSWPVKIFVSRIVMSKWAKDVQFSLLNDEQSFALKQPKQFLTFTSVHCVIFVEVTQLWLG